MPIKRPIELVVRDDNDETHEPPHKRRLTPSALSTGTLHTPYPPHPSDSPSNPFGRKRTQTLKHTLPQPTSFSKHLPLRFQLVRPHSSPRLGGVYRIVQVPLSYTFIHLRCLIGFLFGGGYAVEKDDKHLFEVKKHVKEYNQTYKPGQIKSGKTVVKLSCVRDPCRYRPECDDEDAFTSGSTEDTPSDDDDEEPSEDPKGWWIWAAEEDFTLAHAWLRGGDLTRGIIYHHTPNIAVHITINTSSLPRRSGISNVPFVFQARGRVQLLPRVLPPLPKPVFSVPTHKLTIPSSPLRRPTSSSATPTPDEDLTDNDADGDTDSGAEDCDGSRLANEHDDEHDDVDEGEEEEEEEKEEEEEDDPNAILNPDKWNKPNAFATYLKLAHQHTRFSISPYDSDDSDTSDASNKASNKEEDDDEERETWIPPSSTPGLTHSRASSPFSSSSDFPTSPLFSPSVLSTSESSSSFSSSSQGLQKNSHPYPTLAYGCTPAPPHAPWQRLRIERVSRRMDRMKKEGWMCARDEQEEEAEGEGDNDDDSKVDQLAGEEEEDTKFVKPVLKPGEVWDPFGDECEV